MSVLCMALRAPFPGSKSWNGFVDDHFADRTFLFRGKLGAGLIRVRVRGPRVPRSDGHLLLKITETGNEI